MFLTEKYYELISKFKKKLNYANPVSENCIKIGYKIQWLKGKVEYEI